MRQTSGINPLFRFPFLLLLVVSGFGKVSSTNEECTDALGRECFRYKDEDCVGVYETWARANCSLRCGYCPQKLPCVDNINYCSQFGTDVCQKEFYGQYLRENCRKTCNFCRAPTEYLVSSTTSTTTPVPTTTPTTTYNPVLEWCFDRYNCWRYPAEKCVGIYENWFRKRCPFRCGYCPNLLPPCEDIDTSCEAYSLEACTNLTYRAYMRENCRKTCNECKYPGQNLAPNTPPYGLYSTTTTLVPSTRKVMAVSTKPVLIVPTEEWGIPILIPLFFPVHQVNKPEKVERFNISLASVIGNSHLLQQSEAFNVNCRITGYKQGSDINDTSSVEWLFNGQRISYLGMVFNANKYRLHVKTTNTFLEFDLEIPAVTAEDSGNYTCVLGDRANKNHFQEKSWYLHVICVECSQTIVG